MKRSIMNWFMIMMLLASFVASGIRVTPADALAAMLNVTIPSPGTNGALLGVSGSSITNAYAVGWGGTSEASANPVFYDYDGGPGWSLSSPVRPAGWSSGILEAVWNSGEDVHVVGRGTNAGGVVLPLLYHSANDGSIEPVNSWTQLSPALPAVEGVQLVDAQLYGVWGFSTNSVYAVGYGTSEIAELPKTLPVLYKYTIAGGWIGEVLPLGWSHGYLYDVWGSSASDLYAVGKGHIGGSPLPLIYHYTPATGWTHTGPGLPAGWTSGELYGVWGSSGDEVYAVGVATTPNGKRPLLYRSSDHGANWSRIDLALPSGFTHATLNSIWGSDQNHVFLAGNGGGPISQVHLLYRRTSTGGWAASSTLTGWSSGGFEDLWGSSATDVYAVGSGGDDDPVLAHAGPDPVVPGDVTNLTAIPWMPSGSILLSWTTPLDDYDDANSGPVDSYRVKISDQDNLTSCTDTTGTLITTGLPSTPGTPGSTQTMTISGLTASQMYYFSVCGKDEESNLSVNVALAHGQAKGPTQVIIGGLLKEQPVIPPGSTLRKSYPADSGPVKIVTTDGSSIVASERINLPDHPAVASYTEFMGMPATKLTDTYLFPWYNNLSLDSQLRFANVGTAPTIVTVKIGTQVNQTYPLAVNASMRISYPGVDTGPVEVKSSGGVPIIASERINLLNHPAVESYTEFIGLLGSNTAGTRYLFPWYNNASLDSQLRLGNVGTAATTVTVKIGTAVNQTYSLAINESKRISFPGVDTGPVEITSSGSVPIIASERVNLLNNPAASSYTEFLGLPGATITHTKYLFPWYNNLSLDSQLRVANVGTGPTTVRVKIGTAVDQTYPLAANQGVRLTYPGVDTGPVTIESSGGVPIIASERVNLLNHPAVASYSEFIGLSVGAPLGWPGNQLSTTFWFPWYNNVSLDSQLRFGIP